MTLQSYQQRLVEKIKRWLPSNRPLLISLTERRYGKTTLLSMLPLWISGYEFLYASVSSRTSDKLGKATKQINPSLMYFQRSLGGLCQPQVLHCCTFQNLDDLCVNNSQPFARQSCPLLIAIEDFCYFQASTLDRLRRSRPNVKVLAIGTPSSYSGSVLPTPVPWIQKLPDVVVDALFELVLCTNRSGSRLPPHVVVEILRLVYLEYHAARDRSRFNLSPEARALLNAVGTQLRREPGLLRMGREEVH